MGVVFNVQASEREILVELTEIFSWSARPKRFGWTGGATW